MLRLSDRLASQVIITEARQPLHQRCEFLFNPAHLYWAGRRIRTGITPERGITRGTVGDMALPADRQGDTLRWCGTHQLQYMLLLLSCCPHQAQAH